MQHRTCLVQHRTCLVQHRTCLVQHRTCLVQHRTVSGELPHLCRQWQRGLVIESGDKHGMTTTVLYWHLQYGLQHIMLHHATTHPSYWHTHCGYITPLHSYWDAHHSYITPLHSYWDAVVVLSRSGVLWMPNSNYDVKAATSFVLVKNWWTIIIIV